MLKLDKTDSERSGAAQHRRLGLVVFTAFAAILFIMAAAGIDALLTLQQLHASESAVRRDWLVRDRSSSQLRATVRLYTECAMECLTAGGDGLKSPAFTRLLQVFAEVDSLLKSYPVSIDPDERALIDSLRESIAQHRRLLDSTLRLNAGSRRGALLTQVAPRHAQILELTERFEDLHGRQFAAEDRSLFREFESLRRRLTGMLLVALTAGLVLAVGSLAYILRLEKDARRRYTEIARNRADMERLSARLVQAQEDERRALSRELHDEVGQSLGALLVDVSRLSSLVPPGDDRLKGELGHLKSALEGALRSVRDIALLLRPSMLDDLGLVAALEWQAREISRRGNMEVEVTSDAVSEELPDEHKTCVYRVVQEALNNAGRHAAAAHARVHVRQAGGKLDVSVEDDGKGFDPVTTKGLGLLGMEERVKRLGGTLTIHSRPGKGTTLEAELPLPAA